MLALYLWDGGVKFFNGFMDPQVPNGSGSFLGALQLILYVIYKDWKNTNNDSATSSPPPEKEAKLQDVYQMSQVEKEQGRVDQMSQVEKGYVFKWAKWKRDFMGRQKLIVWNGH